MTSFSGINNKSKQLLNGRRYSYTKLTLKRIQHHKPLKTVTNVDNCGLVYTIHNPFSTVDPCKLTYILTIHGHKTLKKQTNKHGHMGVPHPPNENQALS